MQTTLSSKLRIFFAPLLAALLCSSACQPMTRADAENAAWKLTQAREQELAGQRAEIRDRLLARQAELPESQPSATPYWESRRSLPDAANWQPAVPAEEEEAGAEADLSK